MTLYAVRNSNEIDGLLPFDANCRQRLMVASNANCFPSANVFRIARKNPNHVWPDMTSGTKNQAASMEERDAE